MIFRLKEKQTQFHTLNSDECILWQSKRKDESRGKKYHFPGRCRNEEKKNQIDSIIVQTLETFHDYSCTISHHRFYAKYVISVPSIIFFQFSARKPMYKKPPHSSPPLPPFRALCIITNSVERWVCMWIRTARRPAFHASSFPKSLIFRMVFVLQNAKFMLLLTREWMEEEERTRSGKKKIWWKCDSFRISWCSFSFGVFRFPI